MCTFGHYRVYRVNAGQYENLMKILYLHRKLMDPELVFI